MGLPLTQVRTCTDPELSKSALVHSDPAHITPPDSIRQAKTKKKQRKEAHPDNDVTAQFLLTISRASTGRKGHCSLESELFFFKTSNALCTSDLVMGA
jgi:hypothetical protein